MDGGARIEPTPVTPTALCLSFPFALSSWVKQYTISTEKPYVMTAREVFFYLYSWIGYLKASEPLHFLSSSVVISPVFYHLIFYFFASWFTEGSDVWCAACMHACFHDNAPHNTRSFLAYQVGQARLLPCCQLLKWIFAQYWLALNPQRCLSFACGAPGSSLREEKWYHPSEKNGGKVGGAGRWDDGCVGGGELSKLKRYFLSTGLPLIIQPLSCVSLLTVGPQTTMLCNLALISADSQIEEAVRLAGV